jgi:uncharacterized protein involved in exopolysaccharide biosynthesis
MTANGYNSGHTPDPDMFDVGASLRSAYESVRHHKILVLLTCLATLGLTTWYVLVWPPIYRVEASIMAERDMDPSRDSFYVNFDIFRKDDARTEMELMTAGPVLKEVIETEKLTYDDIYHPFFSEVSYLWEQSWVGSHYHALKLKLFPQKDKNAPSPELVRLGKTLVDMKQGITVQPVGESNVGRVTVKGPSQRVARIASTLLDVYLARRRDRYSTEAQTDYDVLTQQAAAAQKELKGITDRRLAYAMQHELLFDFQKQTQELKDLTDLQATIVASRARVAQLEASLKAVETELDKEPATRKVSTVTELNAVHQTLKLRHVDLQATLIQAQDHYREDSPEVREIQNDLAKVDALIAAEPEKVEQGSTEGVNVVREELITSRNRLRSELEGARAALRVMEQTASELGTRLDNVPAMQDKLHNMDTEIQLLKTKYETLAMKKEQAGVSLATAKVAMPSIRVIEYPFPPGSPWWPRLKILYPVALVLGLMLGAIAAMIKSKFDGRVRRRDVERGRGPSPLYATITVAAEGPPLAVVGRGASRAS